MVDVESYLASIEAALTDADARLDTDLGGHLERTMARLWHGQVLVDWEPDNQAGDFLLRADLLRRLIALHARALPEGDRLVITAPGRIVAGASADHADLVKRLGGARRVEMRLNLHFERGAYRGGEETYLLVERGRSQMLLHLKAEVSVRTTSPRTSPGQR